MSTATSTPTIEGFIQTIVDFTAAMNANTRILERVVAGQEAAIAKLDDAKATQPRQRRAAKTDETPAPAPTPSPEPEPEAAPSFLPAIAVGDGDALKAHIQPWLGEVAKGTPEAIERTGFLKGLAAHLGVEAKFGSFAADADKLKQTLFFFERKKAGLDVDFGAEYDFDGDPKQEVASTSSDDEFD